MPRASAFGQTASDGKTQLSIAQFLSRRSSPNSAHSPSSPRAKLPPMSPMGSPRAHSPRALSRQSSPPNTAFGLRSPRTPKADGEVPPPQLSPRRFAAAGGSSATPMPRKNAVYSSNGDDKVRTPKGRPLDCNTQMILVREVRNGTFARKQPHLTLSASRIPFPN